MENKVSKMQTLLKATGEQNMKLKKKTIWDGNGSLTVVVCSLGGTIRYTPFK